MLLNPQQVRDLLGVSNHSLRYWRDASRLPRGKDNPRYLPAVHRPGDGKNTVFYDLDTVMEFVARNPRYRDHILAKLAPQEARSDLAASVEHYRRNPPDIHAVAPVGLGIIIPTDIQLVDQPNA